MQPQPPDPRTAHQHQYAQPHQPPHAYGAQLQQGMANMHIASQNGRPQPYTQQQQPQRYPNSNYPAPPQQHQMQQPPHNFPPYHQQQHRQSGIHPQHPQQPMQQQSRMMPTPQPSAMMGAPRPAVNPALTPIGPPRPGAMQPPPRPGMGGAIAPPRPAMVQHPSQQRQQPPHNTMAPTARPGGPGVAPPSVRPMPPGPPPPTAGYPQRPSYPGAAPTPATRPGMAAQPNAMRPVPPTNGNSMRPPPPGTAATPGMRPMPPGGNMRPMPPGPNGAGRMPGQMANPANMAPAPPNTGQAPQAAPPAQLPSSAMPRPCAVEAKCGTPRSYFHRGLIANLDQNGTSASIPSSNSDFIAVDDGSASLRYMRLTTNAIANEPSLMAKSGVPLAIVMSPFADPVQGEAGIPVVNMSGNTPQTNGNGHYNANAPPPTVANGPLRCDKCRAYANPGFKFMSGGSQFQCNMCKATCDTPKEHYSPISPANGLRTDIDTRHELRYGSVDYIVGSKDYQLREPKPAKYVYAVDVSASSVQSGVAFTTLYSIRSALSASLLPGAKQGARVAIFTFDESLHFYDARGATEGKTVSMHVVPDVDDPFVPLGGDGFLLTPEEAVAAVDSIIETHGLDPASIARRAQEANGVQQPAPSHSAGCALGSALHAINGALAEYGGKAFVIAAGIPTAGIDKLERRGGGAVGGSEERENRLLKPATPNYEVLGCELAEKQISVDLFVAPTAAYVDTATLVRVPRACGGRFFFYPQFDSIRDSASLHRALCTATQSIRAFDALMRVRTSVGLESAGEYVGHFGRPQRGDDVSGPVFDATQATALEITVTSKLTDGNTNNNNRAYAGGGGLSDDACVQCAVLFTDPGGQRRIRVHTMFANKTGVLADVFRLADVDATVAFLAKKAASAVFANGTPISKAREALVEKTVQALFVYRKKCTSSSMSGQLILPEALKTLPVIVLGLSKSTAFRSSANAMSANEAVSSDERIASLAFLVAAGTADIVACGYPRMWELEADKLPKEAGLKLPLAEAAVVNAPERAGRNPEHEPIALPNTVALSSANLGAEKILLVENALRMTLWIGEKVDKKIGNEIIAQNGNRLLVRAETAGSAAMMKSTGEYGKRVARCIQRVCNSRAYMCRPEIVISGNDTNNRNSNKMVSHLIEDRAPNGAHSYVEFLRFVHKKVMGKIANESQANEMQTWEMLNHGY